MAENLLGRPTISGIMRQTAQYRDMGLGNTSRLLLIGHADGLSVNDPYQVDNLQDAINVLGADTDSPLLRGLIEAYNGGCRDIWIVAAAPMSEYVAAVDDRTAANFYTAYRNRLTATYSVLQDYDFAEVIVPLEAPFYWADGVDFVTQLVNHCSDTFAKTGAVQLGVLGTRIPSTITHTDAVAAMVADPRISNLSSSGKFVMITVGEGLVSAPQLDFSHKTSLANHTAINMCTLTLDRGLTYSRMTNVINISGANYTPAELDLLTEAKLNPVVRTTKAKRGSPFQTVLLTDNTLGVDNSDYWSMTQMRLIAKCANTIRIMGYNSIGTIDYPAFKQSVFDYLANLVEANVIKTFSLRVEKLSETDGKVGVTVGITPFFGLRMITFAVETGPGS